MGIGLIAGREFNERDTLSSPQVAIVNETFARKYYNSAQIVGRTFRLEAPAGKPEKLFQIVGVVKNTKYYELREDFRPQGFFPTSQDDDPRHRRQFRTPSGRLAARAHELGQAGDVRNQTR
jgi:hypothetical protein